MDYKQKIQDYMNSSDVDTSYKSMLRNLFPELIENESKDEKIRKNCIHFLELQKTHHAATFEIEECIAWLEKQKQGEQKPAWSEKDEIALDDALWCCKQAASIAKDENDMGNVWYAERWLKSLKDRVQTQPQPAWSEENERILRTIINDGIRGVKFGRVQVDWLKSIKDRVQPKQEWSEEE